MEGKCVIRDWPEDRIGQDDDIWFPDLLSCDAPVISKDFTIAIDEQNRRALPDHISGLIVAKPMALPNGKRPKPFTASHAANIVATFKQHFPLWHETEWSDLYVEIRDEDVSITHILDCEETTGPWIPFDTPHFVQVVLDAMTAARARQTALVPRTR